MVEHALTVLLMLSGLKECLNASTTQLSSA